MSAPPQAAQVLPMKKGFVKQVSTVYCNRKKEIFLGYFFLMPTQHSFIPKIV